MTRARGWILLSFCTAWLFQPFGMCAGDAQRSAIRSLEDLIGKACPAEEGARRSSCETAIRTLDGRLNDAYLLALEVVGDPSSLRSAQRSWLRTTRDGCDDAACLTSAMLSRIDVLEVTGAVGASPRETPLTRSEKQFACNWIGELATEQSLARRILRRFPPADQSAMTAAERETVALIASAASSNPPNVFALPLRRSKSRLFADFSTGGTCRSNVILSLDNPDLLLRMKDELDGGPESIGWTESLILLRGRYFVLAGGDQTERVAVITPDGASSPICALETTRREVKHALTESQLCDSLAKGRMRPIFWDSDETSDLTVLKSTLNGQPAPAHVDLLRRAHVDIDNDGKPEWVAQADWSSGAACGSSGRFLISLAGDGRRATDERPRHWPVAADEIYDVGGSRYVSGVNERGFPALYKLWPAGREAICEFRDRKVFVPLE